MIVWTSQLRSMLGAKQGERKRKAKEPSVMSKETQLRRPKIIQMKTGKGVLVEVII